MTGSWHDGEDGRMAWYDDAGSEAVRCEQCKAWIKIPSWADWQNMSDVEREGLTRGEPPEACPECGYPERACCYARRVGKPVSIEKRTPEVPACTSAQELNCQRRQGDLFRGFEVPASER